MELAVQATATLFVVIGRMALVAPSTATAATILLTAALDVKMGLAARAHLHPQALVQMDLRLHLQALLHPEAQPSQLRPTGRVEPETAIPFVETGQMERVAHNTATVGMTQLIAVLDVKTDPV